MTHSGPEDLPQILRLLERCGLPQEGLKTSAALIMVAKDAGAVLGCAALEVYGTVGLLRSVAVDPAHRTQALGRQLVETTLAHRKYFGLFASCTC